MVKINFENLGNIQKGEVEINNFTIFSGDNNTGKTYAAYAIYSLFDKDFIYFLKELKSIVDDLFKEGFYKIDLKDFYNSNHKEMKDDIEKAFTKNLPLIFNANENDFKKSKIKFEIVEDNSQDKWMEKEERSYLSIGKYKKAVFEAIKEKDSSILKLVLLDNTIPKEIIYENLKSILCRFMFETLFSNTFLLPAERTGLNLFYKELSKKRTAILHHLSKSEIDTGELIKDLIVSRYPQPIADYIDFLNSIHDFKKITSNFKDLAQNIQKEIIKGKYLVDKDDLYFLPYKNTSNKDNFNQKISLHLASSTVKTFFSLVFYLEHLAQKGETLIIDEPELNLHPSNQRKIARILAMIANRGITVIVSTHSDYFIREVNNLIMLKENFNSKNILMKKYGYTDDMLISAENVNAYLFEKNTIKPMEIDSKEGMIAATFDDVINDINESSDEIYYQKEADLENA